MYIVPWLSTKGGIQEFAKSVYSKLEKKYELKILDWEYDLSLQLPIRGILKYSPTKISAYLYAKIASSHFKKSYGKILNDADLIHFWHPEPATAAAFSDEKFIVTCHGLEILKERLKGFRLNLYSKTLSKALIVHTNSNYTKRLVMKNFNINPERIKIIPPGIDLENWKLSRSVQRERDRIIIGTLTRFVKRKNVLNVVRALNILVEKYDIDLEYYLAGDGPEKNKILEELRKAKFEWKYFGKISEEEKIKKFYPSLDVFVMPPLELPNDVEGFGIVYLEANACGVPVVASNTGGIPDAVKEHVSGVFADPTSPEDIAMEILRVIKDINKYSFLSRRWVNKFDINKIAKEFDKMYRQVNFLGCTPKSRH